MGAQGFLLALLMRPCMSRAGKWRLRCARHAPAVLCACRATSSLTGDDLLTCISSRLALSATTNTATTGSPPRHFSSNYNSQRPGSPSSGGSGRSLGVDVKAYVVQWTELQVHSQIGHGVSEAACHSFLAGV